MAYTILAVLLILVCVGSAGADFKKVPAVMHALERLRVPMQVRPLLPLFKLAGAGGLALGFGWKALGALSGVCLALYFVGATWFHLRVKDPAKDTVPAAVLALVCVGATVAALAR